MALLREEFLETRKQLNHAISKIAVLEYRQLAARSDTSRNDERILSLTSDVKKHKSEIAALQKESIESAASCSKRKVRSIITDYLNEACISCSETNFQSLVAKVRYTHFDVRDLIREQEHLQETINTHQGYFDQQNERILAIEDKTCNIGIDTALDGTSIKQEPED